MTPLHYIGLFAFMVFAAALGASTMYQHLKPRLKEPLTRFRITVKIEGSGFTPACFVLATDPQSAIDMSGIKPRAIVTGIEATPLS